MSENVYDVPRPLAHEDYKYLSEAEWLTVYKLYRVLGDSATRHLLRQDPPAVREHIRSFEAYETAFTADVTAKVSQNLPSEEHIVSQVTDRVARSLPSVLPPPVVNVNVPPSPRAKVPPKPLKVNVKPFLGKQGENLAFWFRQIDMALAAAYVTDEQQKIAFAFSHLQGAAHEWAFTWEINQPGYFHSWKFLQDSMSKMFLPPNAAFKHRADFLNARQGKRSIYEFVQELRKLRASLSAQPIPEDVMVTVFMEGLEIGPQKTEVFRRQPTELEEAIHIALTEDQLQRQARGLPTGPMDINPSAGGGGGPEPMDLSALDRQQVTCYTCGTVGHFARDCPVTQLSPASSFRGGRGGRGRRRGSGRGRGRGGRGGPSFNNVEIDDSKDSATSAAPAAAGNARA
jgi:hypothetical protein